ncbi:PfkB family carbohydrate kinase, partial [Mesorhizobium sp. M1A.F.Ca.IN.020.04.1.1]
MIKHHLPSPEPLHRTIAHFGEVTVLVVGDFILDRFVNGVIERISPEAPIPVLHGRGEVVALGGAGNVVSNIVSLGGAAIPVSVIGADQAGDNLMRMLGDLGADTDGLAQRQDRMTSSKSRFSALNQQVLRFDEEEIKPLSSGERTTLVEHFQAALARADIVILSDYGKGILLDGVAAELIAICRDAGKPVLIDPKGRDYARYAGATAVTPNRKELGEAVGRPVFGDDEIVAAARDLIAAHDFE